MSERLFVRMGYTFNQNPVPDELTIFNAFSPLIYQHGLHVGASYRVAENWMASLSYGHAFENEITGPYVTPLGPIPGASVTSKASGDSLDAGVTVRF